MNTQPRTAQRSAILTILSSFIALTGCRPDHTPPAPEAKPAAPTVLDPMARQIDRAKAQRERMENRLDDLNKQLQQSEGAE